MRDISQVMSCTKADILLTPTSSSSSSLPPVCSTPSPQPLLFPTNAFIFGTFNRVRDAVVAFIKWHSWDSDVCALHLFIYYAKSHTRYVCRVPFPPTPPSPVPLSNICPVAIHYFGSHSFFFFFGIPPPPGFCRSVPPTPTLLSPNLLLSLSLFL